MYADFRYIVINKNINVYPPLNTIVINQQRLPNIYKQKLCVR